MSQKIKKIIEKLKKVHPAIVFALFGLSFFLGDFFLLRADAYTAAVIASSAEFIQTLDTAGVYIYMLVTAYLNAALIFFACRMILNFTTFKYGIKFDKAYASLYLELFATAANLIAALFGILFIKFPFIFINYVVIIRFVIMTVGYVFFAYF
ncbi:MAG: hypothetical protein LBT30_01980, partial [Clostridiales bacterium]|nr:hypothetical protein [Clostridiales bacterium]